MQMIYNFRDIGGCPTSDGARVKKGLLYRSGALSRATRADQQALVSAGIRTVIDLRSEEETQRDPDRLPEGVYIQYIQLPISVKSQGKLAYLSLLFSSLFRGGRRVDFAKLNLDAYREYVADFRQEWAHVIRIATKVENLPILVHCTAGKDRTGFMISLIQQYLGVPEEWIFQDYLLSNTMLSGFQRDMARRYRNLSLVGLSPDRFLPLLEVRREYLQTALEQIRQDYGGIDGYYRDGLGISSEEGMRLRELFLEQN